MVKIKNILLKVMRNRRDKRGKTYGEKVKICLKIEGKNFLVKIYMLIIILFSLAIYNKCRKSSERD